MDVYLVEDRGNNPGRIYAVFAHEIDADAFADEVEAAEDSACEVVKRVLYYGQPPQPGLCP